MTLPYSANTAVTPPTYPITTGTGFDQNNNMGVETLWNANTGTQAGAHIAFPGSNEVTSPGVTDPNWPIGNTTDSMRASIVDYIRMRLGDGLVDVELEQEHYEMGINQALIKYRQRAQNATEESYAFLQLLPETQEYILPKEIMNVRAIHRRGIGSTTGTTASQFEPFASGYLNTYMLVAGRVGGLTNYELFVDYQKLAMTMFGGYINFTFNRTTKKLTIVRKIPYQGANPELAQMESVLLQIDNIKPDQVIFNDPYAFPWIQEYAYSFCKRILGQAYEKFSQIAGPSGGATLNGAALKSEAKEEMDKLEEELKRYIDGSTPLTWVIG
ncbi:MAG TPA: hypothetical protein VFM18_19260 [Methanosarcina sp.]|nr:hypothetical protein [Methanosarcina sp.]